MSSRRILPYRTSGPVLACLLLACCDAASVIEDASVGDGDGGTRDAGTETWDAARDEMLSVEGVDCARFRVARPLVTCRQGTLEEACDRLRDGGFECPWKLGDPRTWACGATTTIRSELVCNVCGGINVEQRSGFENVTGSFSFTASGTLSGLMFNEGSDSQGCMYNSSDGEPCPAAEDPAARAAVSLCPNIN